MGLVYLKSPVVPRHSPIVLYGPLLLIAQHVFEIYTPRNVSVQVCRRPGFHMEPLVQLIQVLGLQEVIATLQRVDLPQPQGLHETVLKHSVPTLYASLGLRTVFQDQLHLQFRHGAAKLRQWLSVL